MEQQLLSPQSNYKILWSPTSRSIQNKTFPASLLASVKSKRVHHQREEKIRRDRMKCAIETLVNVLPQNQTLKLLANMAQELSAEQRR